ncbi:hypothetical protein C8J56DRAFT_765635, partial [Mycena floridula]
DLADRERYCATMILFLYPWRSFQDLKSNNETFELTFSKTLFTRESLKVMENI